MIRLTKWLWHWFTRPSVMIGQGFLIAIGLFGGIIFWGGFNTAMEATNTLEFCISCHEMRDTVYQEYKTSIHYKNPAGVRAICPDCHVPHAWGPKMIRKIQASNELWHKLRGTVGTPAKFEEHRLELATHVWDAMKRTATSLTSIACMPPPSNGARARGICGSSRKPPPTG